MYSTESNTPRPRGKATRYDYSQRACGPSDTSRNYEKLNPGFHCGNRDSFYLMVVFIVKGTPQM